MLSQPKHGRRRAIPASETIRDRRRAAVAESFLRSRGQKLGAAAAVTGMIALTALSAAQADPGKTAEALEGAVSTEIPAAGPPALTADPGAGIAFSRPEVGSAPAPKPAPAPEVQSAGTVQAPAATGSAAPAAGLQAPLASVNVSSRFGPRVNPLTGAAGEMHTGIDLTGACTTAVFAAGAGTVTEAGWHRYGGGNRIVVDHGNGLKTTYNHLARIGVSVGQAVAKGAQIAGVGTTGNSTGCHLHFEVMVNGKTVNPDAFF